MKVNIDGTMYDKEKAVVSVFDHGLLYGDGIFEGIRIYDGRIFELQAHIERLYQSARALLIEIPKSPSKLIRDIQETVEANAKTDGYIRLIVTRGQGNLGIDPALCDRPTVIIIVDDIQLYPESCYRDGIAVMTAASRRMPSDCLDPRIKSLNYLNNILAKLEAKQAGCVEAVMLNKEGFVSECTADNIFIVTQGCLQTPASYHGALDGITRKTVWHLAAGLGIPKHQSTLTRYDLYTADECFLTGTGAEIMPVVKMDGRIIGDGKPGAISLRLRAAFAEYVVTNRLPDSAKAAA